MMEPGDTVGNIVLAICKPEAKPFFHPPKTKTISPDRERPSRRNRGERQHDERIDRDRGERGEGHGGPTGQRDFHLLSGA